MDQVPYQTLNLAGEQPDRVDVCYRLMAQWMDERLISENVNLRSPVVWSIITVLQILRIGA